MGVVTLAVAACHVGLLQQVAQQLRPDAAVPAAAAVVVGPNAATAATVVASRAAPLEVRWVADTAAVTDTTGERRTVSHVRQRPTQAARRTLSAPATVVPSAAFEPVASAIFDANPVSFDREPAIDQTSETAPDRQASPGVLVAQVPPVLSGEPPEAREDVVAVPTYRTRPPGALRLAYQLRRGMLTGTGDFDWKPDGGSYEMRLDGKVAGFPVLSWVSKGGFDAAGLAPARYTDQRRNKQTLAANFQRGPGVITYSQPQTEHPLVPGAQDRLSWMIQLPSILAADASLSRPGAHVAMFVTGARGDADVWSFRVVAQEPVSTPGGTMDAVHLVREARKPHDTQVDVWLDPKRGYLPVHARMANEGGGDAFELSLR